MREGGSIPRACLAALLLANLAAGGCGDSLEEAPQPARPNVLLVSIDSLRADHLGCYGYERDTSPHIDRLAREGALFEQAFSSSSWTLPAHAALFTALPDSVHGCYLPTLSLADERRTLAEALRQAGYATAGFWSGPFLDPRFGFGQGFEEYVDCTGYGAAVANGSGSVDAWSHVSVTSPLVLRAFDTWFASRDARPFFVFVHLWDVHYDFIPPPPYDERFGAGDGAPGRGLERLARLGDTERPDDSKLARMIELYDGEIAWTDQYLGLLIARLESRGLLDDTIVVVTADHGEEFFEHGRFGHRKELYDESVRIPLILRYPPRIAAGTRATVPVSITDVAPTILDLAGVAPLPDVLGTTLSAVIGSQERPDAIAISELAHPQRGDTRLALRADRWKLMLRRTPDGETTEWWDLEADPREEHSLAPDTLPDAASGALQASLGRLAQLGEAHRLERAPTERALDPDLERQLEALGYLEPGGRER